MHTQSPFDHSVVLQANICQCEETRRADDGWNRSLIAQMDFSYHAQWVIS
jgi:hypothetical protein